MNRGTRNLIILGIGTVIFALAVTIISVTIYHNSGDIYLDRSRPGFLPEDDEASEEETVYKFPETGQLTSEILDEFTEHYSEELKTLDTYQDAFSAAALSDENLGISDTPVSADTPAQD